MGRCPLMPKGITDEDRVSDRDAKVRKRRRRMPVNGRSLKALLVERAAKAKEKNGDDRSQRQGRAEGVDV